jgi:rhodanese-related sulfurtransferase
VLRDTTGNVHGVFTGGSMLHGTTGRTDLLGAEHTEALTHAQYHSVRRLADELPADTRVFPTHGFGSFCSATPASGDDSTIADELVTNPALTQDEQTYVTELLAGLSDYPAYYAHMGVINKAGPPPVDLTLPQPVNPDELRVRIEAGEWVVDLRNRTAFAAGHLAGTRGFELSESFVTYLGWLYDWGEPLTLIGENTDQIAEARRELVRIGIDKLDGAAVGEVGNLSAGTRLRSYRVGSFTDLAKVLESGDLTILDVRQQQEYESSHLPGAVNIPMHKLIERMSDVPEGEVWVHCASGYRSSIAASMIDRPGRTVVLVDDEYENAEKLQLTS